MSTLSLAGLIKHVAYTERGWIVETLAQREPPQGSIDEQAKQYEQQTARRAGHADIIRESIDGKGAFLLMAEAEGWADQLNQWMSSES